MASDNTVPAFAPSASIERELLVLLFLLCLDGLFDGADLERLLCAGKSSSSFKSDGPLLLLDPRPPLTPLVPLLPMQVQPAFLCTVVERHKLVRAFYATGIILLLLRCSLVSRTTKLS